MTRPTAIVVALAAMSYWAVQYKRAERARDARAEATTPVVATRPAAVPAVAASKAADGMLRLAVDASGNSWVTLEADGKTVLNEELRKGDRRTFEAKEAFRFRTIGNAAGLGLTLNDVKLPALGSDGEVLRNFVVDREDLGEPESGESRSDT